MSIEDPIAAAHRRLLALERDLWLLMQKHTTEELDDPSEDISLSDVNQAVRRLEREAAILRLRE